ncbi:hypothetical protein [Dactylosporangium maewongense]|uniref:hypothetical protein n=1 Tax=Dactylosporangium maewongense TaxID=634393 RepID=UPI0031DC3C07
MNYKKTDAGWEEHSSFVCTAVAFEDLAFKLAEFVKGDEVEFAGRVRELKVWTPERGEPRAQLGLSLDEVTAVPRRGNASRNQTNASAQRIRAMTYTRSQLDDIPAENTQNRAEQGSSRRPEKAQGSSRTRDKAASDPWPRPALATDEGKPRGAQHHSAPHAPRGQSAVVTNLHEHVARRRNAS